MFFIHDYEVVEIASDRTHGDVARCNVQALHFRDLSRKNGQLDLTRGFQFLLNHEQLPRELFTYSAKHQVGSNPRLDDGGRKRLMNVVHRTNLEASGLILDFSLAGKEYDWNIPRICRHL